MKLMMFRLLIVMIMLVMLASCNDNCVYHEYVDIDAFDGWNKDSVITFQIVSPKLKGTNFDVNLEVRNSEEYAYENIWVYSQLLQSDSLSDLQPIDIPLANSKGEWFGKGWGSYYTISTPIYNNVSAVSDTIIVKIQHAIRSENLKGIAAIGLRVCKHQ